MLTNNFTKALEKPEFKNYQAWLRMTLKKEDVITKIKSWWTIS